MEDASMPVHRFDGTWTHFKINDRNFPPTGPLPGGSFVLKIEANGAIKPDSTVDGRKVSSGTATGNGFDLTAEGRRYIGFFLKEFDGSGRLVIAGRFKGPSPPPLNVNASKGAEALFQDEGTWVITKP
jgi:hypothetical protein